MSFTTMTSGRSSSAAMLLSASQAMPAGERAVADEGDHGAGATLQLQSAGQAGRVRQGGRRVGVLDPVVLGLLRRWDSRTGRRAAAGSGTGPGGR